MCSFFSPLRSTLLCDNIILKYIWQTKENSWHMFFLYLCSISICSCCDCLTWFWLSSAHKEKAKEEIVFFFLIACWDVHKKEQTKSQITTSSRMMRAPLQRVRHSIDTLVSLMICSSIERDCYFILAKKYLWISSCIESFSGIEFCAINSGIEKSRNRTKSHSITRRFMDDHSSIICSTDFR